MRATVPWIEAALALAALAWCSVAIGADRDSPVADSCPEATEDRYFPAGVFGSREWNDSHPFPEVAARRWYSRHLAAMVEPSLSCGALEYSEAYRFLWLRTFDNPIAIRVFRRGDDYGLEAVILDGAGGYEPGRVSRRVTKQLSRDRWRTVIPRLEEVKFWQMPTNIDYTDGTDGAQWIIEARRNARYHIVDRWTATDDSLESVGKLFLDVSDLGDVGPVY